jgi:ABC-2 type transport system ATP-binding protein
VPLVDEVLAVGDEPFQDKCKKQIDNFRGQGKTIIFVSHSADDVKILATGACMWDQSQLRFLGKPV